MHKPLKLGEYKHPWANANFYYPDSVNKYTSRLIDLKITGLPFDDRQSIHKLIDAIGLHKMECMAEEKDGFVVYHAIGYTDVQIESQKHKVRKRCKAVNDYMEKVGRPILFTNLEDTYQTAWEYYELMRYQNVDEFTQKYL